jgi:hypothetical protein
MAKAQAAAGSHLDHPACGPGEQRVTMSAHSGLLVHGSETPRLPPLPPIVPERVAEPTAHSDRRDGGASGRLLDHHHSSGDAHAARHLLPGRAGVLGDEDRSVGRGKGSHRPRSGEAVGVDVAPHPFPFRQSLLAARQRLRLARQRAAVESAWLLLGPVDALTRIVSSANATAWQ